MKMGTLLHEPESSAPIEAADNPEVEPGEPLTPVPKRNRLTSLDAFRGLTILLMLLVNNIALDVYTPAQLVHAPWNETPRLADYVFPWFLLCIGLSLPLSARSARERKVPHWRVELRILIRAAVLILLGCILESAVERKPVFSMGVLQLLGFAYLVGAWLYELPAARRGIVAGFFLLGYGLTLKFMTVPGTTAGPLTEAGNLVEYLNHTFLGRFNLEGVSSAIPAGALVVLGTILGDLVLALRDEPLRLLARTAAFGIALISAGLITAVWIPYNKAIWTPSYLLLTGGAGALVFGLFHLTTDAVGKTRWALPLVVLGSNAIVAYFLPIFVKLTVMRPWMVATSKGKMSMEDGSVFWFVDHFGRIAGGWLYTIAYIAIWWLVLFGLYRKKLFVRA